MYGLDLGEGGGGESIDGYLGGASRTWGFEGNVTNHSSSGAGAFGFQGSGNTLTPEALQSMNDSLDQVAKAGYDLEDAFGQMLNQVLASSGSLKELGQNALQALPQFANQAITGMMPGLGGQLMGGLAAFGLNWALGLGGDESLPIRDNALDVRVINFSDSYTDYAAVRDRSELSYRQSYMDGWSAAALRGG